MADPCEQAIKSLETLTQIDLEYVHDEIASMVYHRRHRFCNFVTCSKEDAKKNPFGYRTVGEMGGEYGYFVRSEWCDESHQFKTTTELTTSQRETIANNLECCYYHGSVCDTSFEDCECRLGAEYFTLCLQSVHDEEVPTTLPMDSNIYPNVYPTYIFFFCRYKQKNLLQHGLHL